MLGHWGLPLSPVHSHLTRPRQVRWPWGASRCSSFLPAGALSPCPRVPKSLTVGRLLQARGGRDSGQGTGQGPMGKAEGTFQLCLLPLESSRGPSSMSVAPGSPGPGSVHTGCWNGCSVLRHVSQSLLRWQGHRSQVDGTASCGHLNRVVPQDFPERAGHSSQQPRRLRPPPLPSPGSVGSLIEMDAFPAWFLAPCSSSYPVS